MDRISVIVPVYKVEAYLKKCIESILGQTYESYEIILVDDGSPDNCPAICDEYERKYDNIYVIHQTNGGLSSARNSGIEWVFRNSKSEWITFVDSDDWLHERCLELLLLSAKEAKMNISCCKFKYTVDRENAIGVNSFDIGVKKTIDVYADEEFDPNSACGRLYQRNLWKDLRFPIGKLHEDRFVTYKLLFQNEQVAIVDAPMYYYYMNNEGICRSKWSYQKLDNLQAIEEQLEFFMLHELKDAWIYTEREYINMLIREMKNVAEFERKDRKTYRLLQKKLRLQLLRYAEVLDYSFKKDINIYKYAWPIPVKLWRRIHSILATK